MVHRIDVFFLLLITLCNGAKVTIIFFLLCVVVVVEPRGLCNLVLYYLVHLAIQDFKKQGASKVTRLH